MLKLSPCNRYRKCLPTYFLKLPIWEKGYIMYVKEKWSIRSQYRQVKSSSIVILLIKNREMFFDIDGVLTQKIIGNFQLNFGECFLCLLHILYEYKLGYTLWKTHLKLLPIQVCIINIYLDNYLIRYVIISLKWKKQCQKNNSFHLMILLIQKQILQIKSNLIFK